MKLDGTLHGVSMRVGPPFSWIRGPGSDCVGAVRCETPVRDGARVDPRPPPHATLRQGSPSNSQLELEAFYIFMVATRSAVINIGMFSEKNEITWLIKKNEGQKIKRKKENMK